MSLPNAHRNDPCPCGSGLKYKACHGRIGDDATKATALRDRGYSLIQQGDFGAGLPVLEQAVAMEPGNARTHATLGVARLLAQDLPAARAALERALALSPDLADAHSHLALVLRDQGDPERALEHAHRALALQPGFAAARFNLAMALLALGRFDEAWPALAWRPDPRVNLRDLATPNSLAHASTLPPEGSEVTLHGEQGLGDTLFFLRFAPLAAARGLRLRFWGDARLAGMLMRSGLVAEAFPALATPPGLDPARLLWVADLPALLGPGTGFAPAVRLAVDDAHRLRVQSRLAAFGPPPYIALTWRAGTGGRGKTMLAKSVPPGLLGAALRDVRATFVSVQRNPDAAEAASLATALGAPLHDLSASNDDLDEALAVMALVDEYVGVSSTNMHLRAGAGRVARVLVPWPPEWRWGRAGEESPWFPGFRLYRAAGVADWSVALRGLAADLR